MKKKLLALALALTMVLGLAACGGDRHAAADDGGSGEPPRRRSGTAFKMGVIGPLTGGDAIYGTCCGQRRPDRRG